MAGAGESPLSRAACSSRPPPSPEMSAQISPSPRDPSSVREGPQLPAREAAVRPLAAWAGLLVEVLVEVLVEQASRPHHLEEEAHLWGNRRRRACG